MYSLTSLCVGVLVQQENVSYKLCGFPMEHTSASLPPLTNPHHKDPMTDRDFDLLSAPPGTPTTEGKLQTQLALIWI